MSLPKITKDGIEYRGWAIQSITRPISSEPQKDALSERINLKFLPEMVYGDNVLSFTHKKSGITLKLTAEDGLKSCADPPKDYLAVKVKAAKDWQNVTKKLKQLDIADPKDMDMNYDWTFSTEYCGTIAEAEGKEIVPEESTTEINIEMLKRRDPILHQKHMILYEDELHDNGVSILSIKLRVMEYCFFCLMRCWTRVDDVVVRVHDTRIFHAFGEPHVIREFQRRQNTFEELKQKGIRREQTFTHEPDRIFPRLDLKERKLEKVVLKS